MSRSTVFLILVLSIAKPLVFNGLAAPLGRDSFPLSEKPYRGYRLSLVNFRVEGETKKGLAVKCDAVNTGRLPLIFSEKAPYPIELVVEIDTTGWPNSLAGQEKGIEAAVLTQKLNLAPGKIRSDVSLKINKQGEEKPPLAAPSPDKPATTAISDLLTGDTDFDVKEACADLVFDTAFVVKVSKKTATLGFVIRNNGAGTARIGGSNSKKSEDNLAVNVYFSGTKKLSRGAMLADGIFIDAGKSGNGMLLPTEKFYAEIKVSLEKKTRFTPVCIFELDPFQTVPECNKTNNTRAVVMPEN